MTVTIWRLTSTLWASAARLEVAADYTRLLEDFGKTDVVSLWNGDTPKAQTDAR